MRDCENCVYARPYGGENDNRCSAWSCEFIDRHEAIEAYETLKAMKETAEVYGRFKAVEVPKSPTGQWTNDDTFTIIKTAGEPKW